MQHPKSMAGSETVLVVEDEQGVRSFVCQTLAAQGYRVLEANGPLAAASTIKRLAQPIHLLLTDVSIGLKGDPFRRLSGIQFGQCALSRQHITVPPRPAQPHVAELNSHASRS